MSEQNAPGTSVLSPWTRQSLGVCSCLPTGLTHGWIFGSFHQVMSIEEVERIIGETQDAVEYQRVRTVCASSCGQSLPAMQSCSDVHCVPSFI